MCEHMDAHHVLALSAVGEVPTREFASDAGSGLDDMRGVVGGVLNSELQGEAGGTQLGGPSPAFTEWEEVNMTKWMMRRLDRQSPDTVFVTRRFGLDIVGRLAGMSSWISNAGRSTRNR